MVEPGIVTPWLQQSIFEKETVKMQKFRMTQAADTWSLHPRAHHTHVLTIITCSPHPRAYHTHIVKREQPRAATHKMESFLSLNSRVKIVLVVFF